MDDNNCWNCKNHVLANGNCGNNKLCNNYIRDTEDIGTSEKLIRYLSKDCYINKSEAEQIMCEMIEIFKTYNMSDYYKIILDDCTFDCHEGFKNEKLNVKYWDKEAQDFGLSMLIESDVHYMFEYDEQTFHEEQDFEGNEGRSKEFIQCKAKLRRLFKRHGLEYKRGNYGFLLNFRKIVGNSKLDKAM